MIKKVFVLLVLGIFLFQGAVLLDAAQPTQKEIKKIGKLMRKAQGAYKKNDLEKAAKLFDEALAINKEFAPLYFEIARFNNFQKKFDEGIANLEKSVKLDPKNLNAVNLLTSMLLGIGKENKSKRNTAKANEYYLKVLDIPGIETSAKDKLYNALFELGINYNQMKKLEDSNKYFTKLLEHGADLEANFKGVYVKSVYQVGINYFNLKKHKEADEYISKLRQIEGMKPTYLQYFTMGTYMLGVLKSEQKDFAKSNELLKEYLELTKENLADPYAPEAHYIIGSNHYNKLQTAADAIKNEDKNKAKKVAEMAVAAEANIVPHLEKAVQKTELQEAAYLNLANFYFYKTDFEKATKAYQTLVDKFFASRDLDTYKKLLEESKRKAKKKK